jgi:glycosyl transferase family 25
MKNFNDIEKIYCINLEKRIDRKKECDLLFLKFNLNVEYEKACEGMTLYPELSKRQARRAGCTQSHLNVLNKIKKNNFKYTLILEDDVEFKDNFIDLFNIYVKQLPTDFCVLYLGGNHIKSTTNYSLNLEKCNSTYCLHSYIVNNSYIDNILEKNPHNFEAIDVYFSKYIQQKFNCYCFNPKLSWQRESYSDIEERNVFYKNII